jgi:LytS/YehU family sensor histidine kinase
VLAGVAINEHFRLAALVAIWIFLVRPLHRAAWWAQLLSYIGLATATGALQFSLSLGLTSLFSPKGAVENILRNSQWIVLQSMLENGVALAFMALAMYRQELREREERERELQRLNLQMELAHLRAQLNPHFLFNALNAANALVGTNPDGARRVLETLADLLRYALASDKRDFVTLAEEVAFVEKYLSIERERFGKRLQASVEVADETLLHAAVPPMLLQPLVENAVKHGIAPKASGGEVRLSIRADEKRERLFVEVRDNGAGMKQELNGAPHNSFAQNGSGVGLANTDARLRKLFGEKAALHIHNSPQGVSVCFSLPLNLHFSSLQQERS